MEKYTYELNPLSSDNLTMFLTISVIMGTLLVLVIGIDKVIIPRLNQNSRFVKWWLKNIIDIEDQL
jgi:hypothetical protein